MKVIIETRKLKDRIHAYIKSFIEMYSFQFYVSVILMVSLIFIVDYYDYPSKIMGLLGIPVFMLLIIVFIMLGGIAVWKTRIIELFKLHAINIIDYISVMLFVSNIGYIFLLTLTRIEHRNKLSVSLLAMCVLMWLVYKRIKFHRRNEETKYSNLHDLRQIYENKINASVGMPILVQEKDVDYDLFKRDDIIHQLYRTIIYAESEKSYVVSLQGAWGSGKTTIINNVKRLIKDNESAAEYIIIDDFDPWLYGTQDTLLCEMYDSLLTHLGVAYSSVASRKLLDAVCRTVADENAIGGLLHKFSSNYYSQTKNIEKLKKRVSMLIQSEGRKVVFFIDNLDRANDDNIIFLFKLINLVFDLPRIVYVLSFEKERIEKVLNETQEFNSRFTEKIIQQEIMVYPIEKEQLYTVYSNCIINLLLAYGESFNTIVEYKPIFNVLIKVSPSIRAFKRIINSVFSQVFCVNHGLYRRDLLAIELIRFLDFNLYSKIQKNARYFVSYERVYSESMEIAFKTQEYNAKGKEILSTIVEQYNDYKEILEELFPNVKRVIKNEDIIQQYNVDYTRKKHSIQNAYICNGQCFDVYFSFGSNSYLYIKESVEKIIKDINDTINYHEVDAVIKNLLIGNSAATQKEFFNRFTNYVEKINGSKREDVILFLVRNVQLIKNTNELMIRDTYDSIIVIIRDLIILCTDDEVNDIAIKIKEEYQALSLIEVLIQRIEGRVKDTENESRDIAEKIKNSYCSMCQRILGEKINIYNDAYYRRCNARALYRFYREAELSKFHGYLSVIVSKQNVYRILGDVIEDSIGEQYNYTLRERDLRKFFPEVSVIDELIEQKIPYTNAEKTLCSMYKDLKTTNKASVEISCVEPIEWEL